jgi:hypothetical protein
VKDLDNEAQITLSLSEDGRHTAVVRIRDKSKRVLKLGLAAVQELIGQDIPVTHVTGVTGF